jgi:hypothetical protein
MEKPIRGRSLVGKFFSRLYVYCFVTSSLVIVLICWTLLGVEWRHHVQGIVLLSDKRGPLLSVLVFSNSIWLFPGGLWHYWSLLTVSGVLSLLSGQWLFRERQLRKRKRGFCPKCGYDLRATPERCPECGTEIGNGGK